MMNGCFIRQVLESVLPVFARLMGSESDKAKEMLENTKTQMFDSVEDAINSVVQEVNKSA